MKKNAFTLIELLAVIIILAIVALIATPIILNVIEDAKKSAGKSEANMILSGINNYCATEDVKEEMDENYTPICKKSMTEEEVKKMVNLGNAEILEIEYSDKLTWLKVKSNGHIYTYQNNAMVEGDLEKPAYVVGDLLKVQVSDSETQNIYVLEVKGDEIIGLLDRNLDITQSIASNSSTGIQPMSIEIGPGHLNDVAWISNEDLDALEPPFGDNPTEEEVYSFLNEIGPVTANKALEERTNSWNKVTRKYLPSAEEILKLTEFYQNLSDKSNWENEYFSRINAVFENEEIYGCSNSDECKEALINNGYGDILLPDWTTINLKSTGGEDYSFGYWTSTPLVKFYDKNRAVGSSGIVTAWQVTYPSIVMFDNSFTYPSGIRPIIHISQSNILEKLEEPEYVNP